MTAFVALLALDERRIAARRLDVAPCLRLPTSAFGPVNPSVDPDQTPAHASPPDAPAPADTAAADTAPHAGVDAAGGEARVAAGAAERAGDCSGDAGAAGTSAKLDGVQSPGPGPGAGLAANGRAGGAHADAHSVDEERWARAPAPGPVGGGEVTGSRAGPPQAWGLSRALQALVAERYAPWLLRPSVQARLASSTV